MFCQKNCITVRETLSEKGKRFFTDSLSLFSAGGSAKISEEGRSYHLNIYVEKRSEYDFICDLYSPFGTVILSAESDMDSINLEGGDFYFKRKLTDKVSSLPFLMKYSFTFDELIRILTCRPLGWENFTLVKDSCYKKGFRCFSVFNNRRYTTHVSQSSISEKIKKVAIYPAGKMDWKIEYLSWKDGLPAEINIRGSENNYFFINYDYLSRK